MSEDLKSSLPPMPKLRPKPGFRLNLSTQTSNSASKDEDEEEEIEEEETTSKLLMKTDCKGRKKNSGSLVHSIPKFSQVKPSGRLTEVQKVLQSRIISKQRQKLIEEQRRLQEEQKNGLQASSLLQNIVTLHQQSSKNSQTSPVNSICYSNNNSNINKRRGRKPAKEEICHVVCTTSSPNKTPRLSNIAPVIPQLSEVTITPTVVLNSNEVTITPTSVSSSEVVALDLRKKREKERSSEPEVVQVFKQNSR